MNCIITCNSEKYSCGSDDITIYPFIICGENTNSCILNCDSNEACYGSVFYSKNSETVNININGMAQNNMKIYAPNYGDLKIELLTSDTSFSYNTIYAGISTNDLIIDCQTGMKCTKNTIYGQEVISYLQYECANYCDSTNILCPNDANCQIYCKNSCNDMIIDAPNINKLDFICDNSECKDTIINCIINETWYQSTFAYLTDNDQNGFMFGECTKNNMSIESMKPSLESLKMYVYYNDSMINAQSDDIALYIETMHYALMQTYEILSDYQQEPQQFSISNTLNITFCVMFNKLISSQCDLPNDGIPIRNSAKYLAITNIDIISYNTNMTQYKQYVINIFSSDTFLILFNEIMNDQLFSFHKFAGIFIQIDQDSISNINDDSSNENVVISSIDINSNHNKNDYDRITTTLIAVFVVIGILGGIMCSILCGYGYGNSKWLAKMEKDIQEKEKKKKRRSVSESEAKNIMDDNLRRSRKHRRLSSIASKSSITTQASDDLCSIEEEPRRSRTRSLHWGFTDENEKYGEIKDKSPSPFIQLNLSHHKKSYTSSHIRYSNPNLPIGSIPEETSDTEQIMLQNDNSYRPQSSTFSEYNNNCSIHSNQGRESIQVTPNNGYSYHKHNRDQTVHVKAMQSISSIEIEDLFSNPCEALQAEEGKSLEMGDTTSTSNYNQDNILLEPQYSNKSVDTFIYKSKQEQSKSSMTKSSITKMGDDLDDFDFRAAAQTETEIDEDDASSDTISSIQNNDEPKKSSSDFGLGSLSSIVGSINQSSSPQLCSQSPKNIRLSPSATPLPNDFCNEHSSDTISGHLHSDADSMLDHDRHYQIRPQGGEEEKDRNYLEIEVKHNHHDNMHSSETGPDLPLSPSRQTESIEPIPVIVNNNNNNNDNNHHNQLNQDHLQIPITNECNKIQDKRLTNASELENPMDAIKKRNAIISPTNAISPITNETTGAVMPILKHMNSHDSNDTQTDTAGTAETTKPFAKMPSISQAIPPNYWD